MKKNNKNFFFECPDDDTCDVLIIAGEHSGDQQAARMVRELLDKNPEIKICAFGGKALQHSGVQLLFNMTRHSVVGFFEVIKNYSFFKKLANGIVNWIEEYKPKKICFVDYPGFNLYLAKILKDRKLSVKGGGSIELMYYISPQIWAWKAKRRFKMEELLDELAVIFPFEVKCYSDTSLPTKFVGHPFLSENYDTRILYEKNSPILLLPGSRKIAVSRIFPIMLKTLRLMKDETAIVPYPSGQIKVLLEKIIAKFPDLKDKVQIVKIGREKIFTKCAMMSSGTASLSCCLEGIPGAIIYRANPLTYFLGRMLVKVKYLSIANILLDKSAWREFIQGDAKPKIIAKYLSHCIENREAQEEFFKDADRLKVLLHAPKNISLPDWILNGSSKKLGI